jgi:hypothetical protein
MSERSARRLLYRQKRLADREDCNHNRGRNRGHDVKRNLVRRRVPLRVTQAAAR